MGNPVAATKLFNLREVDELVLFDVSARLELNSPDFSQIERISSVNFVPLTVGGGVRGVEDARVLFRDCGADKVAVGHALGRQTDIIQAVARDFGCQSVVAVLKHDGSIPDTLESARACVDSGAGELIVQSRGRDGTQSGYDIEVIGAVLGAVSVPVVAASGCGSFAARDAVLSVGADAVAAGALWQFTKSTPLEAKRYLEEKGGPVRIP